MKLLEDARLAAAPLGRRVRRQSAQGKQLEQTRRDKEVRSDGDAPAQGRFTQSSGKSTPGRRGNRNNVSVIICRPLLAIKARLASCDRAWLCK